jgi:hypothetical protein
MKRALTRKLEANRRHETNRPERQVSDLPPEPESSLLNCGTRKVSVTWELEYEEHNLRRFQEQGHFVCSMKDRDHWPNERGWQGNRVHTLTLNLRDTADKTTDPQGRIVVQVLRVMGDTLAAAEEEMRERLRSAVIETAMVQQVKVAAGLTFDRMQKDLAACMAHIEKANGVGSAAEVIRQARLAELVG